MDRDRTLEQGRASFERRAWGRAYDALAQADGETALQPDDLELLATAAYLTGRDDASTQALIRAHRGYVERGAVERAARCAYWLAFRLVEQGEHAQGGGWLARARRLLEDGGLDCVETGYLLVAEAFGIVGQGRFDAAHDLFARAAEIGERFGERDLVTLARHGQGRSLINLGRIPEGAALLDEVMVSVTADEVSTVVVGLVYCSVLSACHDMFDLRRAREWTAALSRWCASQRELVPYRGQCLVRRAEVMQVQGAWPQALKEARRAREVLTRPSDQPAAALASYQLAEVHRLRGEFTEAEEAYRDASDAGGRAQPGLALLRLSQGDVATAAAAVRRLLDETRDRRRRPAVLAAAVEILLAAGDVATARAAADELSQLASALGASVLSAMGDAADGAVLIAEGEPRAALPVLRRARSTWEEIDAPYQAARVRVLMGSACRAVGDVETAGLEMDAARRVFERLHAVPDLARLEALGEAPSRRREGRLTRREREVLQLIAKGKSNRAIGQDLGISEKTVARHVSNMFTKLGVSSRAAATAYAYEHDLR